MEVYHCRVCGEIVPAMLVKNVKVMNVWSTVISCPECDFRDIVKNEKLDAQQEDHDEAKRKGET